MSYKKSLDYNQFVISIIALVSCNEFSMIWILKNDWTRLYHDYNGIMIDYVKQAMFELLLISTGRGAEMHFGYHIRNIFNLIRERSRKINIVSDIACYGKADKN